MTQVSGKGTLGGRWEKGEVSRLPPEFLQCILALGSTEDKGEKVRWTATGFLYGYVPTPGKDRAYAYLVTNRHVLEDLETLYLRLNPAVERFRAREYACPLRDAAGHLLWCGHPDPEVDIAVLPFDVEWLKVDCDLSELCLHGRDCAYRLEEMRGLVSEGEDVFILGFPLGAVGAFRNAPVVRRGCVAQIQELYRGRSQSYLVDAEVFPGNSGGPVILAPDPVQASHSAPVHPALIGVAFAYIAYQDVATSDQTGRARIIFEENTGLTEVHPVDRIDEAIRAHLKRRISGKSLKKR